MSTTQHPLTETDAAGLAKKFMPGVAFQMLASVSPEDLTEYARLAYDLAREHERETTADPHHDPRPWQDCTEDDIREGDLVERPCLGVVRVGVAHHQDEDGDWRARNGWVLTCGDRWPLRRIPAHTAEKETPMPETTTPTEPLARTLLGIPEGYGAPHHDAGRIKPGDYVAQVDDSDFIRAGIAHRRDEAGDWMTEGGVYITWAAVRAAHPDALTVWPAPTPPAVEVEWEPQFGDIITDIRYGAAGRLDRLVNAGAVGWADEAGHFWYLTDFTAFTLPDGTRVRRDGEHANGEPRFVKVQEEA